MSSSKAHQFMESPLVAWVRTFDERGTLVDVQGLVDGVLLNRIMCTVDPSTFTMTKVMQKVDKDPSLCMENLHLLISRIRQFYLTTLQQLVIVQLPNIASISHEPESVSSLEHLERLLVLLLGCVVQCEAKGPLIERLKTMDLAQQQTLVACIQQITDTTDYVCSIDWNDLEDIPKPTLEGLCRTAYLHLQRVAKERDHHFDKVVETTMERDFIRAQQKALMVESVSVENGVQAAASPARSPAMTAELNDTKKQCRQLQEQLDKKTEVALELKEEVEQLRKNAQKLHQEKKELMDENKMVRAYKDEVESLKVQASRVEKLESDLVKLKQKAEDAEYLKKRIADLQQQNELMFETKSILEQKNVSLCARAETADTLQQEMATLKVQLESLTQERHMDRERIEELLSQNVQLEIECQDTKEQLALLQSRLDEKSYDVLNASGDALNLSMEMSEADLTSKAKVLRLEKEAREVDSLNDTLRHSQAKVAELEKTNKKLYNQTHTDRKEIVKLKEEVEVLKVKAARADKLQLEMSGLREKAEESSRVQAKLKEMKAKNEELLSAKAKLCDEVESLVSKVASFESTRDENASLKAQAESLIFEHGENEKRVQELLERNAQLEMERVKSEEEKATLQQLLAERTKGGQPQAPVTILSPPRMSETEMASRAKLQRLEKQNQELEKKCEVYRQSQARMGELEKLYKKLQEQGHADRKELAKLREELQVAKNSKLTDDQLEDAEVRKHLAAVMEDKALLQDEVASLQSKLNTIGHLQVENDALKVRVETVGAELQDSSVRMQQLLEQNAQLEVDRDKKMAERDMLKAIVDSSKQLLVVEQMSTGTDPASPTPGVEQPTQAQLLQVERVRRELGHDLEVLRQSSDRKVEEMEKASRKLMDQLHEDKKELARLKEELKYERQETSRLHADLAKMKSSEESDQAKQLQELESRFNEAYTQSLTTKDERIAVLEKRAEDNKAENELLKDEVTSLRKQINQLRSPVGSPVAGMSKGISPREITRLREQAAEGARSKERLHVLQEDNNQLSYDLMESKRMMSKYEAENQRLNDRMEIMEQLNHTLDEEKRTLLHQMNSLLEKNQEILIKTLASKDQAMEEERVFTDRLGELERDNVRLTEKLASQEREQLARQMDMLKKTKSKNLIKRGFNKLKGKIQGRSHTFERSDLGGLTPSMTASPSHPMGIVPHPKEGSMSSNQSISSSSTGRHSDGGLEEVDSAGAASLVARGPMLENTPHFRPKKNRSSTLPHLSRPAGQTPGSAVSGGMDPDLMSLEDFLNESDKTPNRRKVMELKRASLILAGPSTGPRDSMLFPATSGSASGSFSTYQEFVSQLQEDVGQSPIPEVEESELDHSLHSGQGRTSRKSSRSRASSLQPNPSVMAANSNGNNSAGESAIVSALASMTTITPRGVGASSSVGSSSGTASTNSSPDMSGSNCSADGGSVADRCVLNVPSKEAGLDKLGNTKGGLLSSQHCVQKVSGLVIKKTPSSRAKITLSTFDVRKSIHGSCDNIAKVKCGVGKPPLLPRQFHKSSPALDSMQHCEDVDVTLKAESCNNRTVAGKQCSLPPPPVAVAAEVSSALSKESVESSGPEEEDSWYEYGCV